MIKRFILTSIILAGLILNGSGQQKPLFSQYMINKYLVNPAVAGVNGFSTVNTVFREQYVGFENAPRTITLNAQTRLMKNSYIVRKLPLRKKHSRATRNGTVGLGANIFNDRNGIVSKTGLGLTYAYHINFNNNFQLSMGLSGSAFQFKLDDSGSYLYNPDDPLLNESRKAFWVPDAALGTYITNNRVYAGLSMTDLFGSSLKLGSSHYKDNFREERAYYLTAGFIQGFDYDIAVEPSVMLRATKFETQIDLNTRVYYKKDYWAGFSYRTDKTIVVMAGLFVNKAYFGYAYDASLGSVKNYSYGSHEIMLGVRFGESSSRRFRWIRKDQMEFNL